MSVKTAAIILAGGLGTRIRAIHPDKPKPMIPVDGRPFIEWVIRYLAHFGIEKIVVSSGYKGDQISGYFNDMKLDCELVFRQEHEQLGTGGAVAYCVPLLESFEKVLVLNGDSLVLADIAAMNRSHDEKQADVSMATIIVDEPERYGGVADRDGWVYAFEEKGGNNPQINGGVYIFNQKMFALFPADRPLSLETAVFPSMIQKGYKLAVFRSDAPFLDIGTPESLRQADEFINTQLRPRLGI